MITKPGCIEVLNYTIGKNDISALDLYREICRAAFCNGNLQQILICNARARGAKHRIRWINCNYAVKRTREICRNLTGAATDIEKGPTGRYHRKQLLSVEPKPTLVRMTMPRVELVLPKVVAGGLHLRHDQKALAW
jgi:hypothetical protein